jgi:hypothetical protein
MSTHAAAPLAWSLCTPTVVLVAFVVLFAVYCLRIIGLLPWRGLQRFSRRSAHVTKGPCTVSVHDQGRYEIVSARQVR